MSFFQICLIVLLGMFSLSGLAYYIRESKKYRNQPDNYDDQIYGYSFGEFKIFFASTFIFGCFLVTGISYGASAVYDKLTESKKFCLLDDPSPKSCQRTDKK